MDTPKVNVNELRDQVEPSILALAEVYQIPQHRAVEAYGHLVKITGELVPPHLVGHTIETLFRNLDLSQEVPDSVGRLGVLVGKLRVKNKPFLSLANKIGRNEPCPCKSGAKFKNCCLNKIKSKDLERYNERYQG